MAIPGMLVWKEKFAYCPCGVTCTFEMHCTLRQIGPDPFAATVPTCTASASNPSSIPINHPRPRLAPMPLSEPPREPVNHRIVAHPFLCVGAAHPPRYS